MDSTTVYGKEVKLRALDDEDADGGVIVDVIVLSRVQKIDEDGDVIEWVHVDSSENASPLIVAAITQEAHYIARRGFEE